MNELWSNFNIKVYRYTLGGGGGGAGGGGVAQYFLFCPCVFPGGSALNGQNLHLQEQIL